MFFHRRCSCCYWQPSLVSNLVHRIAVSCLMDRKRAEAGRQAGRQADRQTSNHGVDITIIILIRVVMDLSTKKTSLTLGAE